MKSLLTLALLLLFSSAFAQWERVTQLPASTIFALYTDKGKIYAGGKGIIYYSLDKGQTWDSTTTLPSRDIVNVITFYHNELYASVIGLALYKSPDNGRTWQNISTGIFPAVSAFREFRGFLYASTLGGGAYRLDSTRRNRWDALNNGLSDLSSNLTSLAATGSVLVAGTSANGIYDRLTAGSTSWDELFLLNQTMPSEGTQALIATHDSLLLASNTGTFYLSTDQANSWIRLGRLAAVANTAIANAKQAFLISRTAFNGVFFTTFFNYLKKDSLDRSPVEFGITADHLSYRIAVSGDQVWDAAEEGLFHMPLSVLHGIRSTDEIEEIPLPLHFESFSAQLQQNRTVLLTWTVSDHANAHHFVVERSSNTVDWESLYELPIGAAADYSYTDKLPKININYYRIKQTDIDGRTTYSVIRNIELKQLNNIRIYPNPVTDILHLTLPFSNGRAAITDASGRTVYTGIFKTNQLTIPVAFFRPGIYYLSIVHGNKITSLNFLKQ